MNGVSTTHSESFYDVPATEFDPVSEIRKLRRELADRLKTRLPTDEPEPEPVVVKEIPVAPDPEPVEIVEAFETPGTTCAFECPETPVEAESDFPMESYADTPYETFFVRLQETHDLVARLQTRFPTEMLTTRPQALNRPIEPMKPVEPDETPASDSRIRAFSRHWFAVLKKMNAGLVLVGALGIVMGALYLLRGRTDDLRVGFPIAVVGLTLIVIGWTGRVLQEHLNRKAVGRSGGKLTTAS